MKFKDQARKVPGLVLRPVRGAWDFVVIDLKNVMDNFGKHDGELSTCALAFFLLISFIPSSLVVISILSFFYRSDDMAALYLKTLKTQLPSINLEELVSIIDKILYSKRYHAFIWVPFLFWWGSFVFDIIERGLEKAFHIGESRRYWKAKIRHFIIIIGIGVFALLLTIISNVIAVVKNSEIVFYINKNMSVIPVIKDFLLEIGNIPFFITVLTALAINTFLFFSIYRFVPPQKLENKALLKGALFASLSYEIIKSLFSYYITQINDYSSIFGSLNTIVILMIWIWYTCFLFIIGAELAWVFHEKQQEKEGVASLSDVS